LGREALAFAALTALAVAGRWAQPDWHFTPLAAVAACGGFYFRRLAPAVLLPIVALAISDLAVARHDNLAVMATVYLTMALPLALGRYARYASPVRQAVCCGLCGVVPATVFFLTTNFAVWAFQSAYDKTWQGLLACYAAGLPFYRAMLAGDMFYVSLLAGCWLIATWQVRDLQPARVRVRK
jgi:hypothetical protein